MKRQWLHAGLVGWGAAALVAACSSFSDDAASSEVGEPEAGAEGGDAGASSDSAADAKVDAGPTDCTSRWCDCVPDAANFCDDFDQPGEILGQGWFEAGAILDDGGSLTLTDAGLASTRALAATVPFANVGRVEAALAQVLGGTTNVTFRIAFDVFLPSDLASCTSGSPELAVIGVDNLYTRDPMRRFAFGLQNGQPILRLNAITPSVNQSAGVDGGLATGGWTRVRFDLRLSDVDGGAAVHEAVSFAPAGSDDGVAAPEQGVLDYTGPMYSFGYSGWVWVGLRDYEVGQTQACNVVLDNVAIYRR